MKSITRIFYDRIFGIDLIKFSSRFPFSVTHIVFALKVQLSVAEDEREFMTLLKSNLSRF